MKIGFIGAGNLTQAMIKGLIEGGIVAAENIYVSNRSVGKLKKIKDAYPLVTTFSNNEDLIENVEIVILAVKPQDLIGAIEPVFQAFHNQQIVISLAAGVTMETLNKYLPHCRLIRLMPNTPALIGKGVTGYLPSENEVVIDELIQTLFSPLGTLIKVHDEDEFEALMISCSSGTGFIFELMMYWSDWIEQHGFSRVEAKKMTIETFLGASLLAKNMFSTQLEELQSKVASKKGVTAEGLNSMRELEIERALRISFEKASMRNKEIARDFK